MKKIILVFMVFLVVSCSTDRIEDPVPTPNPGPTVGTLQYELLGTWKAIQYVSSSTQNGGPVYSDVGNNNWYFTNSADGKFKIQTKDHYFEGDYTYGDSGSNYYAVFTKIGSPYLEIFVKNIEGNIYTFQMQGGANITPFTFKAVKQ